MTTYEFTPPKYKLGPKREYDRISPGWCREVTLADGRVLMCTVVGTHKVRIAFRGRQRGWSWLGQVTDRATGEHLLRDRVGGSVGVRGLLQGAGIFPRKMGRCLDCWGHGRFMDREGRSWGPAKKTTWICASCSGTGLTPLQPSVGR